MQPPKQSLENETGQQSRSERGGLELLSDREARAVAIIRTCPPTDQEDVLEVLEGLVKRLASKPPPEPVPAKVILLADPFRKFPRRKG